MLLAAVLVLPSGATAQVEPFPAAFRIQRVVTNGTTLHVRIGGSGPAVMLLHGLGETGDMWAGPARSFERDPPAQ